MGRNGGWISRSDQEAVDEALARALQDDQSDFAMDDAAIARQIQQEEDARITYNDEVLARNLQAMQDEVSPNSLIDDEEYAKLLIDHERSDDVTHQFQGLEVNPARNRDAPSTSRGTRRQEHQHSSPDSSPQSSHSAHAHPDDIDPDNMTYEELNELGESIGDVSKGLKKKHISRLPTTKYGSKTPFWKTKKNVTKDSMCLICHTDYAKGDVLIVLPCNHSYHKDCISRWLLTRKTCCVCKAEVRPK